MTRRKVHEHGYVEIGNQVEQEVLELVLLRAIERELAEDDAGDFLEESGGAQMHQAFIDDGHRIARLLDEENGAVDVDLVQGADRLLHERQIAADESACGATRDNAARQLAS